MALGRRLFWQTISLSALAVAGVTQSAAAQTPGADAVQSSGSVTGTVTDAGGTVPLTGATVQIEALGLRTSTGTDGRFRLDGVPAGEVDVTIDYLNSATRTVRVTVVAGTSTVADVALGGGVSAESGLSGSGDIVVTGVRGSLALARARELASDQFKTIVAADAIGNFADQNVAESLQRLPGISIRRSEGEGQQVAVRGLSGSFVTVTVDGAKLGTRDIDSRSVNLDVISSDLLNGIEVTKTLTPDLDADAIAGSINLRTLSAFDRNKSQITVRGELAIQEKSANVNEKVSGDVTHLFGGGTFGIALSGSYQNRKAVVDEFSVDDGLRVLAPGILSPRRFNLRNDPADRTRISGNANLEFRPSSDHQFFLRGTYAHFKDDDIRARTRVEFDDATGTRIRSFDQDTLVVERVDIEKRFRFTDQIDKLYAVSAGGQNDFDGLKLSYQADYSKNESDQPSVEPRFRERDVNATYDNLGINGADFTLSPNVGRSDPNVPRNFDLRFITQYDRFVEDTVLAGRFDVQKDFDFLGPNGFLKAGVKYQQRERSVNEDRADISVPASGFDVDGDGRLTIADFDPALPRDTILNTGFFPALVPLKAFASAGAAAGRAAGTVTNLFLDSSGLDYDVKEDVVSGYVMAKLRPASSIQVIAGVRVESTTWNTNGNNTDIITFDVDASNRLRTALNAALTAGTATFTAAQRDAFLAGRFNTAGTAVESVGTANAISARNAYTDFFPSLHVRWDVARDVLARFAYTTATRRPDFNQASAVNTIATSEQTDDTLIPARLNSLAAASDLISFRRNVDNARDPQLDPLYAHQFDASVAWYPSKNTFFQVAGFYKRISNFIVPVIFSGTDVTQRGLPVGELVDVNGRFTRTPSGGFNSITTFINGDQANVYGVELSASQNFNFLPGALSGLFVSGNITLSESEAKDAIVGREFTLPDQSKSSWNISAGWEKHGVSIRWSGNYTGSRLIALNAGLLGLADERSDLLEQSRFTMDVNVRVDVNDTLQVYFDALNLNDAQDRNYFRGDPTALGGIFGTIENYGATYQMGLRLRF